MFRLQFLTNNEPTNLELSVALKQLQEVTNKGKDQYFIKTMSGRGQYKSQGHNIPSVIATMFGRPKILVKLI